MHIVVIGSGLLGISTAWFLRQQGADVTVVDRAERAGMETSFANAGMLTPSMAAPWNSPGIFWQLLRWLGKEDSPMLLRPGAIPSLVPWGWRFLRNSRASSYGPNLLANLRLASYSLSVLRDLRASLDLQYEQSTTGTMRVARDQDSLRQAEKLAGLLSARGIVHRILDRSGVVETEPALAPIAEEISCGIHYPDDESGNAHLFCRELCRHAKETGVIFRFGTTVTGFRSEGRRLVAAQAGNQQLDADAFVLAAGSYTPGLARQLGIRVPVKPVKGYSITVPRGDWPDGPRIPVADDGLHAAVVPIGDQIRVAGTAEFTGLDVTIGRRRIENLENLLRMIYPGFADRLTDADKQPWCGLRPMSADGVPVIGSTSRPNVFVNTGHGHLGWTMAAGSGKALADHIVGEQPEIDLSDYHISRF